MRAADIWKEPEAKLTCLNLVVLIEILPEVPDGHGQAAGRVAQVAVTHSPVPAGADRQTVPRGSKREILRFIRVVVQLLVLKEPVDRGVAIGV